MSDLKKPGQDNQPAGKYREVGPDVYKRQVCRGLKRFFGSRLSFGKSGLKYLLLFCHMHLAIHYLEVKFYVLKYELLLYLVEPILYRN